MKELLTEVEGLNKQEGDGHPLGGHSSPIVIQDSLSNVYLLLHLFQCSMKKDR